MAIIVDHEIENPKEMVDLYDCNVRKIFWGHKGDWSLPKKPCTAGEFIQSYQTLLEKL